MRAGELNTYVTFQEEAETEGEYGTETTWQDYVSCWGSLENISGREYFAAQQANSEVTGTLKIRYRDDLDLAMGVIIDGQIYNIETMYDFDQSREELHVILKGQIS